MAAATVVRARIGIVAAGLVGTLAAGVRAAEPDHVLELGVLTDDLVASRNSALVFLPDERDRMREALQLAASGGNASHPRLDPVVARIHEHGGVAGRPIIVVVGPEDFSEPVWRRVKDLVAFRLHRPAEDGTKATDAAIYLVRTSELYYRAVTELRQDSTDHDPVWCLLAAVVSHEAAHTSEDTERQALEAEIAQLRRCQRAGHLPPTDGLRAVSHIAKVEARLRAIRDSRQSSVGRR